MKDVSSANWSEVSSLLDQALDLEPASRGTWLDQLAARSPDLAPTLRRLIAAHAQCESADVLGALPTLVSVPAETLKAGDRIGAYVLKREIASGGMATVWLAARADGGLTRDVALKLPRIGWGPGLADRLARERDILASLEHPHIARLYDAGVDALGRPYLALEYVDGQPIDAYCRDRAIDLRARVELLLQVARALAHAHARLVVHRDLKPSNILVTTDGQVRLLDFGIAKLMEGDRAQETRLTQLAGRMLTFDYASPEQIRGAPIGTASDVYSLGVVAYELLAQTRPYRLKRASAAELEEAIATIDPPLASAAAGDRGLSRQLRGDPDAILNKALKKDAAQRYASVDAFAADLRRYLRGEAVEAQPDSAWYRLKKFVQRHRLETAVAAAIVVAIPAGAIAQAAVLVAISTGAGAALWQARRAATQAALARERAHAAERARQRAERVKETLLSLLVNSDADSGASAKSTVRDLLCSAIDEIEALSEIDAESRVELQTVLGFSLESQGEPARSLELLARTVAMAKSTLGADHPRTLEACARYGALLFRADRNAEAREVLEETVRRARATHAVVPLVWALQVLQSVLVAVGQRAEALPIAAEAAALATDHAAQVRPKDRVAAYFGHFNALRASRRPGLLPAAELALKAARSAYPGGQPPLPLLLHLELGHADALMAEGDTLSGLAEFERVLPAMIDCFGPEHMAVGAAASWMGVACRNFGSPHKAREAFERAESVLIALLGPRAYTTGVARMNVGTVLLQLRRAAQARAALRTAHEILLETVGPAHVESRRATDALALACLYLGEADEAQTLLEGRAAAGLGSPIETARWHNREGLRLACTGLTEAVRAAVAAAREALRASDDPPLDRALETFWAGRVALEAHDAAQAEELLRDAATVLERRQWRLSPDLAECRLALGRARALQGDREVALALWRPAVDAWLELDRGADYPIALSRWLEGMGPGTAVQMTAPPGPR
ncbi:MAG: protein kinase domain-containing protein [Gemmatimonadota bacterium]